MTQNAERPGGEYTEALHEPLPRTDHQNTVQHLTFEELLAMLGHVDDYLHEQVSVCWKTSDGTFRTELKECGDAPQLVHHLLKSNHRRVDVWFGVNPINSTVTKGRGTTRDITRVTALWADLDVKETGCPDLDTAHDIITAVSGVLGERPCAITYSGHGLQPYWKIDTESAKVLRNRDAVLLLARFGDLMHAVAARHGCQVDSVFDLTRILRVPGTDNVKDLDTPVSVWCQGDTGDALTVQQITHALDDFGIHQLPHAGAGAGTNGEAARQFSRRALINRVAKAPEGQRNRTLFGVAKDAARQGDLDEDLLDELIDAAIAVGLDDDEIIPTIESGRERGEAEADEDRSKATKPPNSTPSGSLHLRDRLLKVGDLASLPPMEPLIDGLLYRDTLAQLSGPPGSYKSFVAIGMACAVAAGVSFAEAFAVRRPGRVVYVAAEGANGLRARILAWCEHHEVDPALLDGQLLILPLPVQLGDRVDVSQILEVVTEVDPDLVVLDTRARCTVGLEENSATDQGKAIEAAEQIRAAAVCTVLVVHHSSRNGTAGRGSSAWDGAVWSDLRMDGEGLHAKIRCEKHKEVPDGCHHDLQLAPHKVSAELMPGTLRPERETLVVSGNASGIADLRANSQRVVLAIVRNSAPPEGFSPKQVVELAKSHGISQSSVYSALKSLLDDGELINVGSAKRTRYVARAGSS